MNYRRAIAVAALGLCGLLEACGGGGGGSAAAATQSSATAPGPTTSSPTTAPTSPTTTSSTPTTSTPTTSTPTTSAPANQAVSATRQAMWVWGTQNSASLITFAQAHGVTALFVEVHSTVATDGTLAGLKSLKAAADKAGIVLYALNGDPTWTTDHAAALAWQQAALATGLFAGSHLDVEPYSLPAWQTDQAGTAASYLQLLAELKAASTLPVEVDVPFWYGTIAAPPLAAAAGAATLADAVLSAVDAVTVMSYRNTATGSNSIFAVGLDMLQRAQVAGKPVRLAAETNPTADCSVCSFAGMSTGYLQTALSDVEAAAAGYTTFNGMSVEDYSGWSKLTS